MFIESAYPVAVVDTNQADLLPPVRLFTGSTQPRKRITLTPHVLGEILLRCDPRRTLRRLCEYDIQFGMDLSRVHATLCKLSERDIASFRPFIMGEGEEYRREFYSALDQLTPEHVRWAKKMKARQRSFCGVAATEIQSLRIIRTQKFDRIEQILESPYIQNMVVGTVTNNGARSTVVPSARLYRAVMDNPYVGRLWKSTAYTLASWQRLWKDQLHNFDPTDARDDFADMTLPLWASKGDVLLTRDTKLRRLVSKVEPNGDITCALAIDF